MNTFEGKPNILTKTAKKQEKLIKTQAKSGFSSFCLVFLFFSERTGKFRQKTRAYWSINSVQPCDKSCDKWPYETLKTSYKILRIRLPT